MPNDETIRSMIRFENELINHRLTWMSAFNGLLFTGLGFAWEKPNATALIYVFAFLGIAVSGLCGLALLAANHAIRELCAWWDTAPAAKDYSGPDVIGLRPVFVRAGRWLTTWTLLPGIFIIGWTAILIINMRLAP